MMKQWSCAIAVAAMACGGHPEIKTWKVTPQAYCPSTKTIHVEWNGKGGTTRLVSKVGQAETVLSTDSKGSKDVPAKPMDLQFLVEKSGKAPAITTTTVNAASELKQLGGNGFNCNQSGWMETKPFNYGGPSQDAFADTIRLGSISNECPADATAAHSCKRSVKLEHAGQSWTLAPGATLDVSSTNVVVGGPWTLSQNLLDGEVCGTPSATPSIVFKLTIGAFCTEKP